MRGNITLGVLLLFNVLFYLLIYIVAAHFIIKYW